MYQLNYHYFKRNKADFQPIGNPINDSIKAETLVGINKKWQTAKEYHDVFQYTILQFDSIVEVKR